MNNEILLPTTNEFKKIVLENTPLIDVRAPSEFSQGAFENAVNLPLMNDNERHEVGICYKKKGSDEALKLGYNLVSGDVKKSRIEAWKNWLQKAPNSFIYCFRGGQRSQISQKWIFEELGLKIPRLDGGYKAFRRYLISESERLSDVINTIIIGGRTGSGKTILLHKINNMIDLEGLANHRGSAFGKFINPQPSQIDFENNLAFDLIRKVEKGYSTIVIEDEGKRIGSRNLPINIHSNFYKGKLIILETSIEKRVDNTFEEYVVASQEKYIEKRKNDCSIPEWIEVMRANILKIKKRLGDKKCFYVLDILNNAHEEQCKTGSREAHKEWIKFLLLKYYDPMYDYQIQKRADKVVFRGNEEEIIDFIAKNS